MPSFTSSVQNIPQFLSNTLRSKPSACVLWVYFNEETMQLGPYLYFGASEPGKPMESLADRKTAKHTKRNKDGFKAERENLRVVPKGAFRSFSSVEEVFEQLFGVESLFMIARPR